MCYQFTPSRIYFQIKTGNIASNYFEFTIDPIDDKCIWESDVCAVGNVDFIRKRMGEGTIIGDSDYLISGFLYSSTPALQPVKSVHCKVVPWLEMRRDKKMLQMRLLRSAVLPHSSTYPI